MLSFHVLAYDATIDGTTSVYVDASFQNIFGLVDTLRLAAITDSVTGTSPTLTVQCRHSRDNQNWLNKSGTPEVNASSLNATGSTVILGAMASTPLPPAFVRIRLQLGGTTPRARVRLFVTGRAERVVST